MSAILRSSRLFRTAPVLSAGSIRPTPDRPIAIVGGAAMGLSTAIFLAQHFDPKSIVVFEQDPKYARASTPRAVGGVRQQFSTEACCRLSMWSYDYYANAQQPDRLGLTPGAPDPSVDLSLVKSAYLYLAANEGVDILKRRHAMQQSVGCDVSLLEGMDLYKRFPWLNLQAVHAGVVGNSREGWLDASSYLQCLRKKAAALQINFFPVQVQGIDVVDDTDVQPPPPGCTPRESATVTITTERSPYQSPDHTDERAHFKPAEVCKRPTRVVRAIRVAPTGPDDTPEPIPVSAVVNCAGSWARDVAAMAGIGTPLPIHHTALVTGHEPRQTTMTPTYVDVSRMPSHAPESLVVPPAYAEAQQRDARLEVSLPIEPRHRTTFVIATPNPPGGRHRIGHVPLTILPNGAYFRQEAPNTFLCGAAPVPADDPASSSLEVDFDFFEEHVWPHLAECVPQFEQVKVRTAWGGTYEYCTLDQNAVIGAHPSFGNFFTAAGFSGHGIQQAPAVGYTVAQLIATGKSEIDVAALGWDRVLEGKPLVEDCVIS
eukprot:TRINITY_DN8904_c0_g2_i1.p1 TRINITY_DN8904_c0_g2~~TRINITY_DN8904_c0_g2_i1.p1  ORF type:complete len:542 (+),score=117.42 TRINITY_DN8904_c0_g2_i1:80-1705(+)